MKRIILMLALRLDEEKRNKMKKNNKGYMLVELILSSVLAMTIAFYLINLTYDLKNKDEDLYQSIQYETVKTAITKNIMNDLENLTVTEIQSSTKEENTVKTYNHLLTVKKGEVEELRNIQIKTQTKEQLETTIYYGKWDETTQTFVKNDLSYYEKKIDPTLVIKEIKYNESTNSNHYLSILIPIESMYTNEHYDIKLFVEKEDFHLPQYLNTVSQGSYVQFTGTNGCQRDQCNGINPNYVDSTNQGTCYTCSGNANKNFFYSGFRVAYIKEDTVYLISASSPECLATDNNGTAFSTCTTTSLETAGLKKHFANLNQAAQKYCNKDFAYEGVCNSNSAWNMNANDFKEITQKEITYCATKTKNTECGYNQELIDIGGYYWISALNNLTATQAFYWTPTLSLKKVYYDDSKTSFNFGIRPVLRLRANVKIESGTGTAEDPYRLKTE